MGKPSKKTATSTTTPNPQLQAAYSGLVNQAQGIAGQPLQLYQGNTVAPFSQQQQQAFGQIGQAQGIAQPYLDQAGNLITAGASPITAPGALGGAGIAGLTGQATNLANTAANTNIWGQLPQFSAANVNQYQSPYTQDVVNATQKQFDLQNAQQQQGIVGSAIASGAFGGDRSAVLQAELAGQQQTAQAPVIAGLNQAGYNTALGEFNSQQSAQAAAIAQQAGLQQQGAGTLYGIASGQQQAGLGAQEATASNALYGGYGISGLANEAQNLSLTGSSALLNAGAQQQQLQQEQLNVPYEQYLQSLAYPYQQTDYLSSILGSSNLGQTTTETSKQTQPFSLFHRGGIPHRAIGGGGLAFSPYQMFEAGIGGPPGSASIAPTIPTAAPPDMSAGYVPSAQPGHSQTSAPGISGGAGGAGGQQQPGAASQVAQGVKDYNAISGAFGGSSAPSAVGITPEVTQTGGFAGRVGNSGTLGISGSGGLLDDIGSAASSAAGGIGDFLASAGSTIADAAMAALAVVGLEKGGRAHPQHFDDGGATEPDDGATIIRPDAPDYASAGIAPAPQPGSTAMLSADQMPVSWQGIATHTAPSEPTQNGPAQPTSFWQDIGLAPTPGHMEGHDYVPGDPGWGKAAIAGLGDALANRSLGAGIIGGLKEYEREDELDAHPTVDHSGQTIRIYYPSEKKWVDTGLPSEASINAKAMADYRTGTLSERTTRDQDLAQYHSDEVARQTQADAQRAAYEAEMAGIRAQLAAQGKYGAMTPGKGRDAQGNVVDGIYTLDEKTGQPLFTPGGTLVAKAPGAPPGLTGNAAMDAAQRDYDRLYPVPKPDPSNPGVALPARPVPPEGMQAWIKKRAEAYSRGPQGGTQAAPAPGPAPTASAAPPRPTPPPLPQGVPPGSMYSPSRKMWRDQRGTLYNEAGQPVR